ncbi:NAD(P)H-binding protein [Zophobihabitans entericus]|uniref:NAD(P)H-binding protein n=1 Tax=Zophobihabitans entericus TaxID=1635327 RepID=A0A6G9ICT2_9GAMM|nr:NAD(P)H-binding protein [Zophobihabitans entericus]QIQ21390.1 NAD(P)H-binding protein [Zophobihabitans entericus]
MHLLLIGSTGLVGSHVLRLALDDSRIDHITVLSRKPLPEHPKLQTVTVDFKHLPEDALWWNNIDAVISTLGSTIKKAGSQEEFYKIDHDYSLTVAKLARQHNTPTYVLNSALGANPESKIFYSRVKGELEQDLAKLGFTSLTFVRPGFIGGKRTEFRLGEKIVVGILTIFSPALSRRLRVNPAEKIAKVLIENAVKPKSGVNIVTSKELS